MSVASEPKNLGNSHLGHFWKWWHLSAKCICPIYLPVILHRNIAAKVNSAATFRANNKTSSSSSDTSELRNQNPKISERILSVCFHEGGNPVSRESGCKNSRDAWKPGSLKKWGESWGSALLQVRQELPERTPAHILCSYQRSQRHHRLYVPSALSRREAETGSRFRKLASSRETRSGQSQHLVKQCFLETGGGKKRDSSGQQTRLLVTSVNGWPVHTQHLDLKGLLGKKSGNLRGPAWHLLRHGPFLVSYCIDHHPYLCDQASKSQRKVPGPPSSSGGKTRGRMLVAGCSLFRGILCLVITILPVGSRANNLELCGTVDVTAAGRKIGWVSTWVSFPCVGHVTSALCRSTLGSRYRSQTISVRKRSGNHLPVPVLLPSPWGGPLPGCSSQKMLNLWGAKNAGCRLGY